MTIRCLLLPLVLLAPLPFIVLVSCSKSAPRTITANWLNPLQTIDGFGAASASTERTLTSGQMDFFYTPLGMGLNIIRIRIQPDLGDCEANEGKGNCISEVGGAAVTNYDLANAQAAMARGALVIAGEWSPPGSMKSNGSFMTGGAFIGNTTNYGNLAKIQASFVSLLTGKYGIPIYEISSQNEPDVSRSYASCTWTAQQIHDYVPYLAAALSSAGYPSTKIMLAESGGWANAYATTAMDDSSVAAKIGILASHGYASSASFLKYANVTTQHQWQTEVRILSVTMARLRTH